MEILSIENLKVLVNEKIILDFQKHKIRIEHGDKVAILGENGAGKSTFIHVLLNLTKHEGTVKRNFSRNERGVVFQENHYSNLIKVWELISVVTNTKKDSPSYKQFVNEYQLNKFEYNYVKDLSGGEKQRLTLALTLYKEQKIYFFDEITSGLDYEKRIQLSENIQSKTINSTVLTVSHYFEELENWINKFLIIDKGKVVFWGTLEQLSNNFAHEALFVIHTNDSDPLMNYGKCFMSGDKCFVFVFSQAGKQQLTQYVESHHTKFSLQTPSIATKYLLAIKNWKEGSV